MRVSLVGSTGSIGTQAVEVMTTEPDRFTAAGLATWRSVEVLGAQARALRPDVVAIGDPSLAGALAAAVPKGTEVLTGPEGLAAVARLGDVVLNAVVGFRRAAGHPGRARSRAPAGPGQQGIAHRRGRRWWPGPSRRRGRRSCPWTPSTVRFTSACGPGNGPDEVARLVLTASGGPFRGRSREELATVAVEEALAHPTWRMGPKITVDSSTLMNKGLEVIEAHELFGVDYDRIAVIIHPQSVVHSMVEFIDGSTVAQLSQPDMRLPIGYALGYPVACSHPFGAIDWSSLGRLDFEPPDRKVFACLDLAEEAGRAGGLAPAWLNAGNEVGVAAFLAGRIGWGAIAEVVADTLAACDGADATTPRTSSRPTGAPGSTPSARFADGRLAA